MRSVHQHRDTPLTLPPVVRRASSPALFVPTSLTCTRCSPRKGVRSLFLSGFRAKTRRINSAPRRLRSEFSDPSPVSPPPPPPFVHRRRGTSIFTLGTAEIRLPPIPRIAQHRMMLTRLRRDISPNLSESLRIRSVSANFAFRIPRLWKWINDRPDNSASRARLVWLVLVYAI